MTNTKSSATPAELPFKAHNWTAGGVLLSAVDVRTMEEARALAVAWNRRHRARDQRHQQVATITNSRVQAHATRITAI